MSENKEYRVRISSDFLFRKILAQSEMFDKFKKEIEEECKNNVQFCIRVGAGWSDESFEKIKNIVFEVLAKNITAVAEVKKSWSKERYKGLLGARENRVGRISLSESTGGELSPAQATGGELSIEDKKK